MVVSVAQPTRDAAMAKGTEKVRNRKSIEGTIGDARNNGSIRAPAMRTEVRMPNLRRIRKVNG